MISFYIDRDTRQLKQVRVAQALTGAAPSWVRIVQEPQLADVQVLQVTSLAARRGVKAGRYAIVQHLLHHEKDADGRRVRIRVPEGFEPWEAVWSKSLATWAQQDISGRAKWGMVSTQESTGSHHLGNQLYLAPLGVNPDVFYPNGVPRDIGIVTSGSDALEEAFVEAAVAAHRAGLTTMHIGPRNEFLQMQVPGWTAVSGISDNQLAGVYSRARWVSGLRYAEGFELPVLEGLACGARPICFDTPHSRMMFGDHAVYVPECTDDALVAQLQELMFNPPLDVSDEERAAVVANYDWQVLADGFWRALTGACKEDPSLAPRMSAPDRPNIRLAADRKRRLLFVGDSPTTAWTGFGRTAKAILPELSQKFDITVLGTTHDGCPYDRVDTPYDIYPPYGNDVDYRLAQLVKKVQPDVVLAQHDPWHVQNWVRTAGKVPVVAILAVDGENIQCDYLNDLAMAIWWTRWAQDAGRKGGYTGLSAVVPLGVDVETYRPQDKLTARQQAGFAEATHHAFIVGTVARNQHRKRLDLTVRHFAEWVHSRRVEDAYLYVQTAATTEMAYDVMGLMRYEGLEHRLLLVQPAFRQTYPDATMARVYNSLDVYFATTQGEGWGLPVMEAMACGVPCVVPDWSGLGSWAREAAVMTPCTDISATLNSPGTLSGTRIAVLGGVPSKADNVAALDRLYRDHGYRAGVAVAGVTLAGRPEYRWPAIGQAVLAAVDRALEVRQAAASPLQPVLDGSL